MFVKIFYLPLHRQDNKNEMEKTDEAIPSQVVVKARRDQIADELRKGIAALQAAYREIRGIAGSESLGKVPPIESLDAQWVEKTIGARMEAVRQSRILTSDQKRDTNKHWGRIASQLNKAIGTIANLLAKYPGLCISFDYEANNYTIKDIEGYATAKATLDVPAEAAEHWRLIQAVAQAVKNLRTFEDERDIIRRPLPQLVRFTTPLTLAESWAQGKGHIYYDHTHTDARTETAIAFYKEQEL